MKWGCRMKINLDILADELGEFDPASFNKNPLDLDLNRFDIYKGQKTLSSDCLYIIEAEDLSLELVSLTDAHWLCLGDMSNFLLEYRSSSILVLPRARLSSSLYPLLSSIFASYSDWGDRVLSIGLRNDGIRELFNSGILEEKFKNPILMQNPKGLYGVSCGTLPDDFDNENWIELENRKTAGFEKDHTEDLKEKQMKESLVDPYISESTHRYRFLTTNTIIDGSCQGKLTHCDAYRPFTSGYKVLAKWFNSVFTAIVKRNINDGIVGQSDNNVFIELLGSWHTDKEWLEYQLRSMSWERYQPAFLIVIRLSGASAKLNDSCSRAIRGRLESLFPGEHFFEYKNDVLAIVRHHRCLYDAEEIKVHLTKTFADEDVICAVSLTFYDIGRIRSFYKQCLFLLESGRAENSSQVRFYGNAFFKHFINEYNIDRNFAWLINPKIDLLRVYDDQHNTKLVECLKTYIECGFSKKRTAQKLSIHYNTLTYRLGRIKEIAMIDLEGNDRFLDDELFHILLSAKLIEEDFRDQLPDGAL